MRKTSGSENQEFLLNSVLGFLSLLLVVLIFAVSSRLFVPRIETNRSQQDFLIGDIIQVEVLNGCGVPGIATRFTNILRKNGFDVVESGNFETFDITETLVIDRTGNLDNTRKVASALGISDINILQEISADFFLDATIVIGSDYNELNLKN